jgi:hypothetical protein
MKLRKVFLGKPLHWVPWPIIVALMYWMDKEHFHILHFNFFALALVLISAAVVALFLLSSEHGDRVTREPFPENSNVEGTARED